jgi:hypothetical protein
MMLLTCGMLLPCTGVEHDGCVGETKGEEARKVGDDLLAVCPMLSQLLCGIVDEPRTYGI